MILLPGTGRGIFLWVKSSTGIYGCVGNIAVRFDTDIGTDDAVFDCGA
jgi:hypothetical protein